MEQGGGRAYSRVQRAEIILSIKTKDQKQSWSGHGVVAWSKGELYSGRTKVSEPARIPTMPMGVQPPENRHAAHPKSGRW